MRPTSRPSVSVGSPRLTGVAALYPDSCGSDSAPAVTEKGVEQRDNWLRSGLLSTIPEFVDRCDQAPSETEDLGQNAYQRSSMTGVHQKITPADIPAGPLAGVTLNLWTVKSSGREHIEGCGRLARSKPNVTSTITIPRDAHLDYLWERLPDECDTCLKHHPYIKAVQSVLRRSDWFDDVFAGLWKHLDIELYATLVEREDDSWLEEVPDELVPFRERLRTDRAALIARWASEVTGTAAKIDMLAYLFGYRNPPRRSRRMFFHPETPKETVKREARNAVARAKAEAALETGEWSLVVQPDLGRHRRLLTRQYWSASRSSEVTLVAMILPAVLVSHCLPEHEGQSDESPAFTVVGPVPAALASDDFCDTFLRCLPGFLFRSFGRLDHPQQQSLDLRPFLHQVISGTMPERAAAPAQQHSYSRTVLEEARGCLADVLSDLDLNIADWHAHEHSDAARPNADASAARERTLAEIEDLFGELSEFVRALPLDDPLIAKSETYLRPIWDDQDGRISGVALYPYGSAYRFLEQQVPERGEFQRYLRELIEALAADWQVWQEMCAFHGADARWPLPPGAVWMLGDKPLGGNNAASAL